MVGAKALRQRGGGMLEDGERPGRGRGRGTPEQGWRMGWGLVSPGLGWGLVDMLTWDIFPQSMEVTEDF